MRTAVLIEIEESLFDTGAIRAAALRDALHHEGASIDSHRLSKAHAGVPAALALLRLAPLLTLDAISVELALHRANDTASRAFALHTPLFDAKARDALERLGSECPIAVVTRATAAEAHQWLEGAGLEACVATVRSLTTSDPADYVTSWADALRRTHATCGVAIAAPAMLRFAQRAGLRTIQIGPDPDPSTDGYQPDAQLESLSQVHAAFVATLQQL